MPVAGLRGQVPTGESRVPTRTSWYPYTIDESQSKGNPAHERKR